MKNEEKSVCLQLTISPHEYYNDARCYTKTIREGKRATGRTVWRGQWCGVVTDKNFETKAD